MESGLSQTSEELDHASDEAATVTDDKQRQTVDANLSKAGQMQIIHGTVFYLSSQMKDEKGW